MILSPPQITTEQEIAKIASQFLAMHSPNNNNCELKFSNGENIIIPTSVLPQLAEILSYLAKGDKVNIVPIKSELTTSEASEILNVSRPYLVQLLESGEIPFRKVGVRRRILAQDLMIYQEKIQAQRRYVLEKLTAQAQELNMGY
ncbi:helix-turn-helix domain-containing protein [Geminocystis herdmanii]|uniref:helix-turn-helix domain-containing protein n=1 Tax=Geminocystis herdmanii TaxID=669359 RepID=UPI00034A892E|nr:helix-turn-helix domain-containing protein [Geminocystis herdmanii]